MNKLSGMLTCYRWFFFILSVALASVDSWAACSYSSNGHRPLEGISPDRACKLDSTWGAALPLCTSFAGCSGDVMQGIGSNSSKYYYDCFIWSSDACAGIGSYGTMSVKESNTRCHYQCSSRYEADSANCLFQGNVWQDSTCKVNHCKAADSTWLSTSIEACTGSNNYAIVNTDSTCEHVGTCCPNDSIPSGNTCKWRCDSVLTTCDGRTGDLFGGVLPDTSVSGQDTTFSYQCYYNCSHSPNPDSTVYLVEGNIVLSGPSDSIPDGIKSETFNSVRTTTGGVYIYDYLSPSASEYIDSIAAMKCVEHLWRCVINNKYVYWYDNQEVPAGCTNIVRVK